MTDWLRRQLGWPQNGNEDNIVSLAGDAATVAIVVHERASSGTSTTLRQLPQATGLPQRRALSAVAELERSGLIVIERDVHDALESAISLGREIREELEKRKAA
ncbi:hypothetical protein ACI5KX_09370 [Erythrobacter sp. GH1-10]|uniref:hypothetical protein n=1 Tax=Erythrobacter sp. GH1-10 TaxID=3349334 RepID=UPI003877B632